MFVLKPFPNPSIDGQNIVKRMQEEFHGKLATFKNRLCTVCLRPHATTTIPTKEDLWEVQIEAVAMSLLIKEVFSGYTCTDQ